MRKFLLLFCIIVFSISVYAQSCETDAAVRVKFLKVVNSGAGGNLQPNVFVGTSATSFADSERIPLSKDGIFVTDPGYVENVEGVSLQRVDGGLRFLLFGGSYWSKETLVAEITLENATITSFSNDYSRASTSPRSSNSLENQGNGAYKTDGKDDELFYQVNGRNSMWYTTVVRDNDGFYLYVKCDPAPPKPPKCSSNADCGVDGYVSSPVCSGKDVVRTYQAFTCSSPGTAQAACSASNSTVVVESCSYSCSGGSCTQPPVACSSNADCGVDGYVSSPSCSGNDVIRNYQTFTCSNPNTASSSCSSSNSTVVVESCSYRCSGGVCTQPSCGNGVVDSGEECDDGNVVNGDGCSSACKAESTGDYIYVISYVGDIDGAVDDRWFSFYEKITDFYNTNKIPGSFSLYPATMLNDATLDRCYRKMYEGGYVELIQKGYDGSEEEQRMDQLSYARQKEIVKMGQDAFRKRMSEITGKPQAEINVPITYDQIGARFTDVTMQALEELGFKTYFDVYVGDGLQPIDPTPTFDVIQYGVSFTTDGSAGPEIDFKTKDEVISEIKNFSRTDVPITRINGHLVVPIWVHQQDFEVLSSNPVVMNQSKWDVYASTMLALKDDPEIRLVTVNDVYRLRHNISDPPIPPPEPPQQNTSLCQYAKSASANSENSPNSLAKFAVGKSDAPTAGECIQWSGSGYAWTPSSWNVKGVLTLTYENAVYVSNLTVFGDYDMCWDKISLKNSKTGVEKVVLSDNDESCTYRKSLGEDFLADTVILTTCGWAWSATDAVEVCGSTDANITVPEPPQPPAPTNVTVCKWKGCRKGAVSVSVDDEYSSCMPELEAQGYRGTYFLTNTDRYTADKWKEFADGFSRGHELGTHMQEHWCMEISSTKFYENIENNIKDITSHTTATRDDIVAHAYPCGFVVGSYKTSLQTNWNFLGARGYNFNKLEESTPTDFYDLKSYNSHGYPGGDLEPPSYFGAVDEAESQGKWFNLVMHNECDEDGVISYFPSKNVWVDTVGNVLRYIKLRDAAVIYNYGEVGNEIRFSVKVADGMERAYYKQDLTLQVPLGTSRVSRVTLNNIDVQYSFFENAAGNSVVFNVSFPISGDVVVVRS